jgi:glycosyltransferase involved in cell wall biosynthesis
MYRQYNPILDRKVKFFLGRDSTGRPSTICAAVSQAPRGFRPDAGSLHRAAEPFVTSSTGGGLGTAVLDAMAIGFPVVAAAAGGLPKLVADGVTGRPANPEDPDALAQAVIELLADPAKAQGF